jgi:hypothetical protein
MAKTKAKVKPAKKKVNIKPRIKKVFVKTVENGGNVTKAMRELKYAETTINNPQNVTKTKSWQELLKELSDEKLMKVLDDGLGASRVVSAMNPGKSAVGTTSDFIEVPDFMVRHKYLETGLKIKNRLKEEGEDKEITVKIINYQTKKKPNAKQK